MHESMEVSTQSDYQIVATEGVIMTFDLPGATATVQTSAAPAANQSGGSCAHSAGGGSNGK